MVQYSITVSDDEMERIDSLNTKKFESFNRAQIMRACMLKGLQYFEKTKI